jgi:hypothetical protein
MGRFKSTTLIFRALGANATPRESRTMRSTGPITLLGMILLSVAGGCASGPDSLGARVRDWHESHFEARQATQQARIADRQAHRDAEEQRLRAQVVETMEAKMGMKLVQHVQFGQPKIDLQKLKAQIDEVEKDNATMKQIYDDFERRRKERLQLEYEQYARQMLAATSGEAGCQAKIPCPPPMLPARLPPVERALLPTEIPLEIPAVLSVTFQNPQMEEARVRRYPVKQRCDKCGCQDGNCGCEAR